MKGKGMCGGASVRIMGQGKLKSLNVLRKGARHMLKTAAENAVTSENKEAFGMASAVLGDAKDRQKVADKLVVKGVQMAGSGRRRRRKH